MHKRSGYEYRIQRKQGNLVVEIGKRGAAPLATRPMAWFVGSGAEARSYLLEQGGFLFQSPVTYYAAEQRWDLSPGYANYERPMLTRPIASGCLQCHASRLRRVAFTQNGYDSPPFAEGGVSCERCHGAGSDHIAAMRARRMEGGLGIVNPAKLAPPQRDSVCAQCHLTGTVRVNRKGRGMDTFVPGERLSDHVAVFVREKATNTLRVTSHVENLAQSACKQGAGDRLWCGSCHDAHSQPTAAEKVSWYRAKCLSCHAREACEGDAAQRGDCIACHMPRAKASDAQHVVYTDHSIPRQRRVTSSTDVAGSSLKNFDESAVDRRDLGIAYAIVGQRDGEGKDRALSLLDSAVQADPQDSEAMLYLAELYKQIGNRGRAAELFERAIRIDKTQLTGSVSLGAMWMEDGRVEDAILLWRDALRKNPGLVLVRFNLAVALLRTGRLADAREMLEATLFYDPAFAAARKLIDELQSK